MAPTTSWASGLSCLPWLRQHGRPKSRSMPSVTTITELHAILGDTGGREPLPPANAVDEVYPGIFIGDEYVV